MALHHLPADQVQSHDRVICAGGWRPVTTVIAHSAGAHPRSPIADHLPAWEIRTTHGVRWAGPQHDIHLHRG